MACLHEKRRRWVRGVGEGGGKDGRAHGSAVGLGRLGDDRGQGRFHQVSSSSPRIRVFSLKGEGLVDHGEVRRSEGGSGMDF